MAKRLYHLRIHIYKLFHVNSVTSHARANIVSVYFKKNYQRAFGTWPLKDYELTSALNCAIQSGYRAIDTAQMYQNETETGQCITDSGIPRGEFLITTKVMPANFDEKLFMPSVEQSLKDLKLDVIDVLLLHWPPADGNIEPTIKLLNSAMDEGLTKNIGLSNYTSQMMRQALQITNHPLVTNQVEFHPLLNQGVLLSASKETGIPLASYCSVARGEVFKHDIFNQLGAIHNKSAGQIVLRWIMQQGVSLNTMSTNPDNIRANYNIDDFTLSDNEMDNISALTAHNYRIVNKSIVPWAPVWD